MQSPCNGGTSDFACVGNEALKRKPQILTGF